MSIVVLASGKGSPGVTTTALALTLTWPLADPVASTGNGDGGDTASGRASRAPLDGTARVCLVDGDLAGSGIAPGYLRGGVPDGGGLVGYAIRGGLTGHARPRSLALEESGRRTVLLGLTDPAQARSVAPVLRRAIEDLDGDDTDVVVDLGRLVTPGEADAVADVVRDADLALVVCRSTLASVSSARHVAARFRSLTTRPESRPRVGAVVVGAGRPYPSRDVARGVGVDVAAEIAWDPDAAAVLSDGAAPRWRFTQSALLRSARAAATGLRRHPAPDAPTATPAGTRAVPGTPSAGVDDAAVAAREVARG